MKATVIAIVAAVVVLCLALVACAVFWGSNARRQVVGCYVPLGFGAGEWQQPCPTPSPTAPPPTPDPTLLRSLTGLENWVTAIAFSPDGAILAVAETDNKTINLWRVSDNSLVNSFSFDQEDVWASAIAFSGDGALLAAASAGAGEVRVWQVDDGTLRYTFPYNGSGLAISPDGTLLAAGYLNPDEANAPTIGLWRLDDGSLYRTLPIAAGADGRGIPNNVSFSADGSQLAFSTNAEEPVIEVWQVADGSLMQSLLAGSFLNDVLFSPDGSLLVAGNTSNTTLWRTADWTVAHELGEGTEGLAFAPNGRTLATYSLGTILLWDTATGRPVRSIYHTSAKDIAFSPDGSVIATAAWYYSAPPSAAGTEILHLWQASD